MSWVEWIRGILFPISDIEVLSYDKNIIEISLSILEILSSYLMIIWVYVDYKENITIIKERKTTNVSIIKNVLSKRKIYISELNIDVY